MTNNHFVNDTEYLLQNSKPFLKWAGGKRQIIPEIAEAIPEAISQSDSFYYIEPFVGSGAMLFYMLRTYRDKISKAVINDINPHLITVFQVIRDNPEGLIYQLKEFSDKYFSYELQDDRKAYFLEQREFFNTNPENPIINTALLMFLNRTCFNGLYRTNSKGKFNVPFGKYKNPRIYNPDLIHANSAALKKVIILQGDYQQTLTYASQPTLFYFDPPYKPISQSSSFTAYSKDAFSDDDQIRLKEFCDNITENGFHFILSNSDLKNTDPDNSFFDDLYQSYIINRVQAKRNINSDSTKRGKIFELLISNDNILKQPAS